MSKTKDNSVWDFSPVFDLIHSLEFDATGGAPPPSNGDIPFDGSQPVKISDARDFARDGLDAEEEESKSLGNFNKLWDYLGVKRETIPPSPSVPHFEVSAGSNGQEKDAYISDGALYVTQSRATAQQGGDEGGDEGFTDGQPSTKGLTKTQRKKLNRKLRKAALAADQSGSAGIDGPRHGLTDVGDSTEDSEASMSNHKVHAVPRTPKKDDTQPAPVEHRYMTRSKTAALRAQESVNSPQQNATASSKESKKDILTANSSQKENLSRKLTKPPTNSTSRSQNAEHSDSNVKVNGKGGKSHNSTAPLVPPASVDEARRKLAAALQTLPSTPTKTAAKPVSAIHESLKKRFDGPQTNRRLHHVQAPSTPQPASTFRTLGNVETRDDPLPFPVIGGRPATASRGRHEVIPLVNQTQIERNWSLFLKVLNNFPSDRKHLVSPLQLSINRPSANGIHVFVDASNIMIGFNDHLRRARGIPQHERLPQVDLNFHALALLLERRRPTAKRVLTGSTPEVAAFEEARQVGYETCILDKVYKAREMTDRQKYFHSRDRGYTSGSASDGAGHGVSEGSPKKWVEQAVDEILHLKILESVVDTVVPAEAAVSAAADAVTGDSSKGAATAAGDRPTMVLATGDAAEAEYSPGFLRMVTRALEKGWIVEVMAFGKSVSMGYRRMERLPMNKGGWGERFKIIELDEYSEELFGRSMSGE